MAIHSEAYFYDMEDEELLAWGKEHSAHPPEFTRVILHRFETLLDTAFVSQGANTL